MTKISKKKKYIYCIYSKEFRVEISHRFGHESRCEHGCELCEYVLQVQCMITVRKSVGQKYNNIR